MRSDTERMIDDNPTNIVITRKAYDSSSGVRTAEAPETLASQTVRLYSKNTGRVGEGDDFRFTRVREVRMLCEHDADVIQHSDENEDTFSVGGKTYRISDVRDITWDGVVISKQCILEEMT